MEWQPQGVLQVGRREHELPDCPLALGLLGYDGDFLGQWYIRDATRTFNPQLQVHRSLDQDDAFRRTFFDGRQGEFEDRVVLLLTLSGLIPLKYGAIGVLTDPPDILALSRSGHLYVVECTLLPRLEMPVGDEQLHQDALSCIPQSGLDDGTGSST